MALINANHSACGTFMQRTRKENTHETGKSLFSHVFTLKSGIRFS